MIWLRMNVNILEFVKSYVTPRMCGANYGSLAGVLLTTQKFTATIEQIRI